jgi:phage shock protein C
MVQMRDVNGHRTLVRNRKGRMLAGVCGGVAEYFGLDAALVRVIWAVVAVVTGGAGVLAYLVGWMIIPEAGEERPLAGNRAGGEQDAFPADGI